MTATTNTAWPSMARTTRLVLLEVLIHGALPRAEIAVRLGLSKTTLTRIGRELVGYGFLAESGTELRAALGRPSELLRIVPDAAHFVGVKLTGDHLYCVVTDLSAKILRQDDEPLQSNDVPRVVDQIAHMVKKLHDQYPKIAAVGITLAGIIHRVGTEQVVLRSHFLDWDDVHLARLVSSRTGLPTATENDVQALTAAEHWFGAGAGLKTMALVTIGAGIGCGLIINDQLVEGAHGMGGRISHLAVNQSGSACELGHPDCAAAYLTNEAIARRAAETGRSATRYDDALRNAAAGDPRALLAFREAGIALGCIIGTICNLVDPQKVILTGDGLALYELARDSVWEGITRTFNEDVGIIDLDVQAFDFTEWARSGAVLAIRTLAAD